MKKFTLILVLAFSSLYFTANAQSVQGGIIVMPQFTGLINTNDFAAGKELDYSLTTGFAGGLSGAYNFNNHVGIEINLLFSGQGEKYKGDLSFYKGTGADTASYARLIAVQSNLENNTDSNYTDKISLTYLKVPVLFKLTSSTEKNTYFYMNIGPEFNFLLSASESFNGNTVNYTSTNPTFSFTTKQLFNATTVDVVLNLGVGIKLTDKLTLTAQVNFDYGLGNAEDKSFVIPETTLGVTKDINAYATNRSSNVNGSAGLRLGLAYTFSGGK